jgi:hypothetical protein
MDQIPYKEGENRSLVYGNIFVLIDVTRGHRFDKVAALLSSTTFIETKMQYMATTAAALELNPH